jgi:hypothetical protein
MVLMKLIQIFFIKLVFNINQFDNSSVIIAGDWNVVQDYRVDTVNYIILCQMIQENSQVDSVFY